MRERLRTDYGWTKRQRQVLALLAAGKTNAEVAVELGISRDGAKWHVAEILSKLQATSREEAAEYWRRRNGMVPRFARVFRGLIGSTAALWIASGAIAGGVVAGMVLGVAAMREGGGSPVTGSAPPMASSTVQHATAVLSDGTDAYDYKPQLAYIAEDGETWLADATGDARTPFALDCTANWTMKAAGVFTVSLQWSPDGSHVLCITQDLVVQAASAAGGTTHEPFATAQCATPEWAPDGTAIGCERSQEPPGITAASVDGGAPVELPGLGALAWSPSGQVIVTTGTATGRLGSYILTARDGRRITTIDDANVAQPQDLVWNRAGTKLAYPGASGITIVDVLAGGARRVIPIRSLPPTGDAGGPGANLFTNGMRVDWVLGDTALLIHRYTYAALIDVSTLKSRQLPASFGNVTMAPDGVHGWSMVGNDDGSGWRALFVNVDTQQVEDIEGSAHAWEMDQGPVAIFSGDSKRACWTPAPGNAPEVYCAHVGGGPAVKVAAPVQVEPDTMGYGDASFLWRAFSPDLTKIAYTTPGLGATGPQTLMVSNLDGSGTVTVGPAFGSIPYRWRPDGVFHRQAWTF